MTKLLKNVMFFIAALIGLFVVTIVVLDFLGIDTGFDLEFLRALKKKLCPPRKAACPKTKIKRNYTELILPEE